MSVRDLVDREKAHRVSRVMTKALDPIALDTGSIDILFGVLHVFTTWAACTPFEEEDFVELCRNGFRAAKENMEKTP